MGLNRNLLMGQNVDLKVVDGSTFWGWNSADNKTIAFTVPLGIKRIKVSAKVDHAGNEQDRSYYAVIENTTSNKKWGEGYSGNAVHQNIDSIVGVTPNKTYTLHFNCLYTSGVTFSWGKEINAMTPTVEDY